MTSPSGPEESAPSQRVDVNASTLPPRNGQQIPPGNEQQTPPGNEQQTPPGIEQQAQPKSDVVVMSRTRLILESLFLIAGMGTYIADLVTDTLVAVHYILIEEYGWSGLTIAFIIIPSLTIQYFSFRWFVVDSKRSTKSNHAPFLKKVADWILWLIVHVLQLGVLKRYWRTVKYYWKSQERPDYYDLSVYEYRDITMLRLIESFMEAAPQLVLQVYIMTQQQDIYWLTATSAIVSLASLAWGIEAYHKALRESCSNKNNIGYIGLTVRMAWRTFTITARVISLALFAAFNKWLFIPLIGVHYIGMTFWLIFQDTDFCTTRVEEVLFDAVIGVIHIFCFFNMKEGRTRYRALFFYTIILIENTVMFAVWYHYSGEKEVYGLPALVFVWGGFFLGIFVMLFYYRCLHPNGNIRLWGGGSSEPKPALVVQTQEGRTHARDETDGPIPWEEVVVPSSTRGCHGNLFSHRGRRYCYWRQGDVLCPCDVPLTEQDRTATTRQPAASAVDVGMIGAGDKNEDQKECDCQRQDKNSRERIETLL